GDRHPVSHAALTAEVGLAVERAIARGVPLDRAGSSLIGGSVGPGGGEAQVGAASRLLVERALFLLIDPGVFADDDRQQVAHLAAPVVDEQISRPPVVPV